MDIRGRVDGIPDATQLPCEIVHVHAAELESSFATMASLKLATQSHN